MLGIRSTKKLLASVLLFATLPWQTFAQMHLVDDLTIDPTVTNRAGGTYEIETNTISTVSAPVVTNIKSFPGVTVTPDDTTPSSFHPPDDRTKRVLRVCNRGTNSDTFLISEASISQPATLHSLRFADDNTQTPLNMEPIVVGTTATPSLSRGQCIGIVADIEIQAAIPNSKITLTLTATSQNAPNSVQDDGTVILGITEKPVFSDPGNPALPPSKLVDGQHFEVATYDQVITYSISFRNSGSAGATHVIVRDTLDPALTYVPDSLKLNESVISDRIDGDGGHHAGGQMVEFVLGLLAPNQVVNIRFQAKVKQHVTPGKEIINTAFISGDNMATAESDQAIVVVDPVGTVFDGRSGGSIFVPGAQLTLSTDPSGSHLLDIGNAGYPPNAGNQNPFTTPADGSYSFSLPWQYETLYLKVTAPSYKTRTIRVNLNAASKTAILHALDGQPLAMAEGFTLTNSDVEVDDVLALAENIPLFESGELEVQKSADRRDVDIGDTVNYRITVQNPFREAVKDVVVRDFLPQSFHYVVDSARLESNSDRAIPAEVNGQNVTFHLGSIGPSSQATISYRVRVGVNARTGEQVNTAVAEAQFESGESLKSRPASASVIVGNGIFSAQQVIIGRVFVDANGNGSFDQKDTPVEGVRVYIDNGQSVTTDKAGMYNFPALEAGAVVISLDPITLPTSMQLSPRARKAGWARLLRTPLGGGGLLKQDFALDVRPQTQPLTTTQTKAEFVRTTTTVATTTPAPAVDPLSIPIAAGEVRILTPAANEVVMSSALEVEAQVAEHWTLRLELNGERISEQNIGSHRVHLGNKSESFRFVGLNVKPGPNTIRVSPIDENGVAGTPSEITVIGRGPAKRLEIISQAEVPAGGRVPGVVKVRAYDAWNHLAADAQVIVETSSGLLMKDGPGNPQQVVTLEKGEVVLTFVGDKPGTAKLSATTGTISAEFDVRVIPETRPTILVGLAELSIGNAAPEMAIHNDDGNTRSHFEFFYKGKTFGDSLLTVAYDSQRPLNRNAGRDRFSTPDPLERVYPIFGDSSTRNDEALSNSKLYFRLDHKRSFLMFGDMDAEMSDSFVVGYGRKLTGVKLHLENSSGAQVVVTGARPDTGFAREVFPAEQFSLIRLEHFDVLLGSETVTIETHDRRNPDVILSRETLIRSIDYNLDRRTGQIYFLRPISSFDLQFNIRQIVVTYEYRASGMSSAVYTAKASKKFSSLGLTVGGSIVDQRQGSLGSFRLAGFNVRKGLVNGGELAVEWGRSSGHFVAGTNSQLEGDQNGDAMRIEVEQPIRVCEAVVRANFSRSSRNFVNPFGATVTPGSQRITASIDLKPLANSTVRLGFTHESNKTENVDNRRLTFSALWNQHFSERLRASAGFDLRKFSDTHNSNDIQSKLFTMGLDWDATDKLHLSVKREQNLGEADPSYPNQTTLTASYQVNSFAKLFVAQRLSSAPIMSIADTTSTGFTGSSARRETQVGIESKLGRNTNLIGRYQLENGINGTDSFAVIGLQQRLPISKTLAIDFGAERGMHLAGSGAGFTTGTVGFSWTPNENFKSSAKFDLRNQDGRFGRLISLGAAGRIVDGVTALARFQSSKSLLGKSENSSTDITGAAAIRPLHTDRFALLFSYNGRSFTQKTDKVITPTVDRQNTLSTDGLFQVKPGLEVYGKLAVKFSDNGRPDMLRTATTTYLVQGRVQKTLSESIDAALEARWLRQPVTGTSKQTIAAEVGYWVMRDLRVAAGYNFSRAQEPTTDAVFGNKRGFYVTISSKLSRLFNLIGTEEESTEGPSDQTARRNQ